MLNDANFNPKRLRQVHRAASELRRGVPVILAGDTPLLILAAETAGPDALAEFESIARVRPVLILAPTRASAILRSPMPAGVSAMAVAVPDALYRIEVYGALADPMMNQPVGGTLEAVAAPIFSDAAIALAKIGRLLPALLAAPLPSGQTPGDDLIEVPVADFSG